jgi:hypothetical protein
MRKEYFDGTNYDGNSFFASVEKKVDDKHSINISGFTLPRKKPIPMSNSINLPNV